MCYSKYLEDQKRQEQALKKVSSVCTICSGKYNYYNMKRHYNTNKHKEAVMIKSKGF